jgi:C_GCAxxG_C_C family probable redox protein
MSKKINDFTTHYYKDCDYNCCDTTLWAIRDAWDLDIPDGAFKLTSGFGGGCCNGDICGAIAAGVMGYSYVYTTDRAHASPDMRKRCKMLMQKLEEKFGSCRCDYLKANYRDDVEGCLVVVKMIADVIDELKDAELPED